MLSDIIHLSELLTELKSSPKNIFIRGAGVQGRALKNECNEIGIDITAFLDANQELENTCVCDIPVLPPQVIYDMDAKDIFVLCSMKSEDAYAQARMEMMQQGLVEKEHFIDFGLIQSQNWGRRMLRTVPVDIMSIEIPYPDRRSWMRGVIGGYDRTTKNVMPGHEDTRIDDSDMVHFGNVDVRITTCCTLRCKNCSYCMELYERPRHFDVENIVRDVEKLAGAARIAYLSFLGGEAFLHPNFLEIVQGIKTIKTMDHISNVRITTNATILPTDEFMIAFKQLKNANICISDYGSLSRAKDDLIELCKRFDIPYIIYPLGRKWNIGGDHTTHRGYTQEELEHLFAVCRFGIICNELHDGKLYTCPRIASLDDLKLIEHDELAFVDIRATSGDVLQEKLVDYVYNTKFYAACQYCDGFQQGARETVPALQQRAFY